MRERAPPNTRNEHSTGYIRRSIKLDKMKCMKKRYLYYSGSCDVGDVFMNIMLYHSVGSTESTGFQRPCTTEARISHSTIVPFPNFARLWALKGCYYDAAGVPLCGQN